jgi:parallel beta-helix repeat protein
MPGDTVRFYASVMNEPGQAYQIDVFRLPDQTNPIWSATNPNGAFYPLRDATGYLIYPGDPQYQQHRPVDYKLGCKDFWAPTATPKKVEPTWTSGLYFARFNHLSLNNGDLNKYFYAPFVVRSANPGSSSKILFKFDFNTFMAYDYWGGGSLYSCAQDNESLAIDDTIATDRPIIGVDGATKLTWAQYKDNYTAFLHTLDSLGYSMEYCNNIDVDKNSSAFMSNYNTLLIYWHDEYWSRPERDNIGIFKGENPDGTQSGLHGNIARFAPNTCYWRIHWLGSDYRKLWCHKGDCSDGRQSDLWRDTQYGPGLPEAKLLGEQFDYSWTIQDHEPPDTVWKTGHWIFNGTGLQHSSAFGYGFLESGVHRVGLVFGELDNTRTGIADFPLDTLAQSWVYGYNNGTYGYILKQTVYYEDTTSNARVFADGSSGWNIALDSRGDNSNDLVNMRKITDNIFSHFSGKKYIGNVYAPTLTPLLWNGNIKLDGYVNVLGSKKLTITGTTTVTADSALFVNGELEINGAVTIAGGGSLNINPGGVLRLKANSTLNVNPATFIMDAGSTIIYESGAKLVLNQAVIFGGASLTVASGGTLQVVAGGSLSFGSGSNLIALGTMTAIGSSQNRITFTSTGSQSPGSWGPIQLSGSGANGSTISYANILYGTEVDVFSANNVTIQSCNITNNSVNGIYASSSSYFTAQSNTIKNTNVYHGIYINGGSTNSCYYNVISKTNHNQQGAGILYAGTSGTVGENDIDYYNWGIAAIWGASPNADHTPATKNNRVTNCQLGLNVYYQSYCNFGQYTYAYTWNLNSIHDNRPYNAAVGYSYPTVASGLYAEDDWWNNASLFYVGSACYGYFTPTHSSDPWYGYLIPSNKRMEDGVVVTPSIAQNNNRSTPMGSIQPPVAIQSNLTDSLLIGVGLRDQNKHKEAKDFFRSYLNIHPNSQAAYVYLYSCADSETTPAIVQYFNNLPKQADNSHKLLLAYLYLMQGDVNSARQVNNAIIASNPNTPLAVKAKLNNFDIALHFDHDASTASAILSQVENQASLSTPMELSTAEAAFKYYVDPKTGQMPNINPNQGDSSTVSAQAVNDGSLQNYPNPFNPSTSIVYRITQPGKVSLKVYDVLGREVVVLVNGEQGSGTYTQRFDASHLSSGIYFYRLIAPGVNQTRKMLIAK